MYFNLYVILFLISFTLCIAEDKSDSKHILNKKSVTSRKVTYTGRTINVNLNNLKCNPEKCLFPAYNQYRCIRNLHCLRKLSETRNNQKTMLDQ